MTDKTFDIESCLKTLLSFYDLEVDVPGLLQSVPFEEDVFTLDKVTILLENLGFNTKQESIKAPSLKKAQCPVIIRYSDQGYALYMPHKAEGTRLHGLGIEIKDQTAFNPAAYKGEALYLDYNFLKSNVDTEHMKSGHALDWFWEPILKYWSRYSDILLCSFFINVLVLVTPLYTLNIYDRIVTNFVEETLVALTFGVVIAMLFDFLFKSMRSYMLEGVAESIGGQYDLKLMERLFKLKTSMSDLSIGEKSNIFAELQGIREFYAGRLMPVFIDFPFIFLFIGIIYVLSPPLALVPLLISVVILLINFLARFSVRRVTEEYFGALQRKASLLIETLAGMETAKIYNAVGGRLLKWDSNVKQAARVSRRNYFTHSFVANLSAFIAQTGHVFIVFFGVYQIQAGNMTIGGLIACSILSGRAIAAVVNVASVVARLKQSNDVLKAIDNVFSLPHEAAEDYAKSVKGPFAGQITVKDISYQYEGQTRLALEQVNLAIKPGESVGLIGKTAAGKTTLSKILANILTPQNGNVYLDHFLYGAIPATELARTIAYVPQETFFFKGSIRYNIVLGRENVSEEDLERAIHVSGLNLVIGQTSQGLDTDVGEFGFRLSGGQKQAIALARAIVRNPQVLIFDEPTTGMDNVLEQRVKDELKQYIKDKTFVMVTHRTTLLPLVDRLVLMDAGHIVLDGPRDAVLKKLGGQPS